MTHIPSENPKGSPEHAEGRGILGKVFDWTREKIAGLWREDPEVAAVLTDAFLQEFKREFERMRHERRERAEGQSFADYLTVHGFATEYNIFDVLVKHSPAITKLSESQRREVIRRLMKYCGLPLSSQI